MDVQSVAKAQKANMFANASTPAGAPGENGSPENAFSALLNLVGAKFSSGSALGTLENKMMHSNDAAHAVQAEDREEAAQNAPRAVTKPKPAKSDDDQDAKAAKNDDDSDKDAATTADKTSTADAAAADQTQTAVQAAVAATVALPVAAAVQTAPVVAAVQQTAVTEAVTGPVAAAVQTAAAVDTNVVAAATVTTPEQVAAAAPVIQKAAGPVVEQAQAADTGPKTLQAAATVAAAADTSADTDTTAVALNTVTTAKAATAKTDASGPKETRSAAAVDQSQGMSRMLGDDNKIQVQVQVAGKAATAQTLTDASPYNIYTGYTGAAQGSTANGQVGDANATNALVQSATKVSPEAQAPVAPIVLPPQLQLQQAPAPAAAATARVDATAPIQALDSTGSSQNDTGFESFGGHAQGPAATGETKAASQTATDRPQVTAQQIVDQIKVVINRATKAGMDKVTIQLKPLELGRIDVKLEMSSDHKVSVTVTADSKDTLALLKSDSHTLERTLNEAGLRTDSANLHFNLRSESDTRQADQNASGQGGKNGSAGTADANGIAAEADPTFDYAAAALTRGGVDTFA